MGCKVQSVIGGGGKFEVTNRTVMNRAAYSQDIEPYTFVSLRTGHDFNGAKKLGLTMSEIKVFYSYYDNRPAHIVKVGTNKFCLLYTSQSSKDDTWVTVYARILQVNGDSYTLGTALSLGSGNEGLLDVNAFSVCKLSDTKIVLFTGGGCPETTSSSNFYGRVFGLTISGNTITSKTLSPSVGYGDIVIVPILLRVDSDTFYYEGASKSEGWSGGSPYIGDGTCKFSTGESDRLDSTSGTFDTALTKQVLHKGTLQESNNLYAFDYAGTIYKYRSFDTYYGPTKVSCASSLSNSYYRKVIELDSSHFLVAGIHEETSKGSWLYLDVFYDNGSSISKTASFNKQFDTTGGTSRTSYIDMYKHTDGRVSIHVCGSIFVVSVSSNYKSITWIKSIEGVNENEFGASSSLASFIKVEGDTYYTLDKHWTFYWYKYNSQGASDATVVADAEGKYITAEKITVSKFGKVY